MVGRTGQGVKRFTFNIGFIGINMLDFQKLIGDCEDKGFNPLTQKDAIALLRKLPANGDCTKTANRLRDIYTVGFEREFWDRIGDTVKDYTTDDLGMAYINPMVVMAAQAEVSMQRVQGILSLKRCQFWQIIYARHDYRHPIKRLL